MTEYPPVKNTFSSKQVILAVVLMVYNSFFRHSFPQIEGFLNEGTLDIIINLLGVLGISIFRNVSTTETSFTSKKFNLK